MKDKGLARQIITSGIEACTSGVENRPGASKETNSDKEFGEEKIHNENQHRGHHNRLRRGTSNSSCPPAGGEPKIAPHQRHNKGKEKRLQKTLGHVPECKSLVSGGPIFHRTQAHRVKAHEKTTQHSEQIGENREKRKSDDCGEKAGGDQFAHRISPQSPHGINLLADNHGPNL